MSATFEWTPVTNAYPTPGQSYLILVKGPGQIADVAFYEGIHPNGDHWWILGDISLSDNLITHWAEIIYPEEEPT